MTARNDLLQLFADWGVNSGKGARDRADRILTKHQTEVLLRAAAALEVNARQGDQDGLTRIYKRAAVDFLRGMAAQDAPADSPPADLRGGFWPGMTGGLCSVCHIAELRGGQPDPDCADCRTLAGDRPADEGPVDPGACPHVNLGDPPCDACSVDDLPQDPCGNTHNDYGPCDRPVGHPEIYHRNATGTQRWLDAPADRPALPSEQLAALLRLVGDALPYRPLADVEWPGTEPADRPTSDTEQQYCPDQAARTRHGAHQWGMRTDSTWHPTKGDRHCPGYDGPPFGEPPAARSADDTQQLETPQGGGRPTHPDGTPYRYADIVAGGWDHCDGCRTWGQWTQENPHNCPKLRATAAR